MSANTASFSQSDTGTQVVDFSVGNLVPGADNAFDTFSANAVFQDFDRIFLEEGVLFLLAVVAAVNEGLFGAASGTFSFFGGDDFVSFAITGAGLELDTAPTAVPIPAAMPLLISAFAGLGFLGWRSKRRAA